MQESQHYPDLNVPHNLSEHEIEEYRTKGHVLIRGVCLSHEIEAYRYAILEAVRRLNTERRRLEDRDTYGRAFLQTLNLWTHDEACRQFVISRRFAEIAAKLMNVSRVRLYHDQALFKEPSSGYTPWHQDQHYWPLATDKTITMWMPLVDLNADMGVMNFASGSHTEGYLGDFEISDKAETQFNQFIHERGYTVAKGEPMRAGDATFHSGWTLHNASANRSKRMREVMTIIYYEDGAFVAPADNKNRQLDLETWLPNCIPGELAASHLNPVLFP